VIPTTGRQAPPTVPVPRAVALHPGLSSRAKVAYMLALARGADEFTGAELSDGSTDSAILMDCALAELHGAGLLRAAPPRPAAAARAPRYRLLPMPEGLTGDGAADRVIYTAGSVYDLLADPQVTLAAKGTYCLLLTYGERAVAPAEMLGLFPEDEDGVRRLLEQLREGGWLRREGSGGAVRYRRT